MPVRRTLACLTILLLLAALAGVPLKQRTERKRSETAAQQASPAADPGTSHATGREGAEGAEAPVPEPGGRRQIRRNAAVPKSAPARAPLSAVSETLVWLARHANADGSWGMVAEVVDGGVWTPETATALALLAFLGAGYTDMTRETWDSTEIGPVVGRGLRWLADRPAGDSQSVALTALALSEHFGLTGRSEFRPRAEAALEDLVRRQIEDGSWGDPAVAPWGAMALVSAQISGIDVPEIAGIRARNWFALRMEANGSPADALGWMLLARCHTRYDVRRLMRASTHSLPSAENLSFTDAYLGSLAAFRYDGPGGEVDKRWVAALDRALARSVRPRGGWDGDAGGTSAVVRNALGTLSLERYYAYANVFGDAWADADPLPPLPLEPEPDPDRLAMGEEAPESYEPEQDADRLRMGEEAELSPPDPGSPEPSEASPEEQ
ncbi:MAG: hypothetical protein HYY18_23415 [Planctomycetes bacterium]|nr:hypothetical protein [Planctomycetota bacterium]